MTKEYTVIIYADSLDPDPDIKTFGSYYDAQDYAYDMVAEAVQWRVDHSPYSISEEELEQMYEEEWCLVRFSEKDVKTDNDPHIEDGWVRF
jgi:hypothetical protein